MSENLQQFERRATGSIRTGAASGGEGGGVVAAALATVCLPATLPVALVVVLFGTGVMVVRLVGVTVKIVSALM